MRASVEPGCFELMAHVGERRLRLIGERHSAATDESIDVEHTETNAFHVKCSNRELERLALVEHGVAPGALRLALEARYEALKALFGSFSMVRVDRHDSRDEMVI